MVLEKVKEKGGSPNPFFFLGGPEDAGQPGKKERFGGVLGGRR